MDKILSNLSKEKLITWIVIVLFFLYIFLPNPIDKILRVDSDERKYSRENYQNIKLTVEEGCNALKNKYARGSEVKNYFEYVNHHGFFDFNAQIVYGFRYENKNGNVYKDQNISSCSAEFFGNTLNFVYERNIKDGFRNVECRDDTERGCFYNENQRTGRYNKLKN